LLLGRRGAARPWRCWPTCSMLPPSSWCRPTSLWMKPSSCPCWHPGPGAGCSWTAEATTTPPRASCPAARPYRWPVMAILGPGHRRLNRKLRICYLQQL
uniref:Secreted protein n=1 Tax=Macrostomum lignano TaxID=282301 RepID=A0A1I8FFX0_9PLAT